MNKFKSLNDLDNFIELIVDLAFVKDIYGVFTHCNESYLNFIGKTRSEVIGKSDHDLLSKEDAYTVTLNDKSVIQNKKKADFTDTIIMNNNYVYFHTTKQPLFDKNNKVFGIFCVARDITIEKQYEIIYNDTNELLEYIAIKNDLYLTLDKIVELAQNRNKDAKCSILLLDDSKEHLIIGSAKSLPDFYNKAITGIKIGNKIGSCGSAAYHKKRVIVGDINTHENWSDYLGLTKKANLHSCWSEPIFSLNNDILGTFAMYTSYPKEPSEFELRLISTYAHIAAVAIDKYNNHKNMIMKDKLLFEQSKMVAMGEMIGNIAHQWRQPLSVISTAATGMKIEKEHGLLTDANLYKSCIAINNNAQYLSKTIDDFKNFIKGDRRKKIFNLKDNIKSFLNLVEGSIKSDDINMILDLQEDIKIDGYKNELTQCIINVFNNAKDVLIEKEIKNKLIFISTSIKDNKAIIKLKDNGGGIPQDIINKLFEPYFTTKHQSQGTGLGLHMTYNFIVDGMGGTIDANNIEFKYDGKNYSGAEFIVSLPMQ